MRLTLLGRRDQQQVPRLCRELVEAPALVVTAQADVLRDEGEAHGRTLRAAGIDVTATRYEGVITTS